MSDLQATVKDYDPGSGAGSLVFDDGTQAGFGAGALRPPVRLLRSGQRVRLRLAQGEVVALTLVTFPLPE